MGDKQIPELIGQPSQISELQVRERDAVSNTKGGEHQRKTPGISLRPACTGTHPINKYINDYFQHLCLLFFFLQSPALEVHLGWVSDPPPHTMDRDRREFVMQCFIVI